VINSNFGPIFHGFRDMATYSLKLRPNHCKQKHGYYWQPRGSRQRPI